jgi:hypothetical protein
LGGGGVEVRGVDVVFGEVVVVVDGCVSCGVVG